MIEVVKVTNDTHGRAEFGPALERAFQEINSSSECHHVIAIFTDGDVEIVLPTEPFAMYNSEKKVCMCECVCVCVYMLLLHSVLCVTFPGQSVHLSDWAGI